MAAPILVMAGGRGSYHGWSLDILVWYFDRNTPHITAEHRSIHPSIHPSSKEKNVKSKFIENYFQTYFVDRGGKSITSSIIWGINMSFHKARWIAGGKENIQRVQGQIFLVWVPHSTCWTVSEAQPKPEITGYVQNSSLPYYTHYFSSI